MFTQPIAIDDVPACLAAALGADFVGPADRNRGAVSAYCHHISRWMRQALPSCIHSWT
jgi:hypothetical protein